MECADVADIEDAAGADDVDPMARLSGAVVMPRRRWVDGLMMRKRIDLMMDFFL